MSDKYTTKKNTTIVFNPTTNDQINGTLSGISIASSPGNFGSFIFNETFKALSMDYIYKPFCVNPKDLAKSIVQLLSLTHEQRIIFGGKSRQRALDLFTQKTCVQTYLDTYLQLIRQARISELKLKSKS